MGIMRRSPIFERKYSSAQGHDGKGFWNVEIPPLSGNWYPARNHLVDYIKVWICPQTSRLNNILIRKELCFERTFMILAGIFIAWPCNAQWKDVSFGLEILAVGVETRVFCE